jgi:hypothetical protein
MTGGMILGLLLLTRTTATSSAMQIDSALVIFGLGAGLGLPALTDTVMAAVPERDAGVGSAVNDVSRQLGGALGVAIIGSVVSSAYRANLHRALPAGLPSGIARSADKSIGVATQAAKTLPTDAAAAVTRAANSAYVDAITRGFLISGVVMISALIIALTLLPRRMRAAQADADELDDGIAARSESASSRRRLGPFADVAGPRVNLGLVSVELGRRVQKPGLASVSKPSCRGVADAE